MLAMKTMTALGKPMVRPALTSSGKLVGASGRLADAPWRLAGAPARVGGAPVRSLSTSPLLSQQVEVGPATEIDKKRVEEQLKVKCVVGKFADFLLHVFQRIFCVRIQRLKNANRIEIHMCTNYVR
jgi:hypothetical protein